MPPDPKSVEPSGHLERVLRLRTMTGFAAMTPNEVAVIAENTVDRHVPAGAEIYAEGEPVTAIHYLLEGRVAFRRKGETTDEFEAPAVVGGLGALAGQADGQQLVAVDDCWTLEMGADVMVDVFEDNFTLLLMVIRAIAAGSIEARKEAGPTAGFDQRLSEADPPERELELVDRLFYLRRSVTFARGRLELLTGLAAAARERREPAGTRLWSIGDSPGTFLVLISGVIACSNERQSFRFGPGDVVGGLDSLAAVPRWFDAEVETDLVALEVDSEVMIDLYEDNVHLAVHTCRAIARMLIALREENAHQRSEERRVERRQFRHA